MSRFTLPASLILVLVGCKGDEPEDTGNPPAGDDTSQPADDTSQPADDTGEPSDDQDGDGYTDDDCDDSDASVNPGATEVLDNAIDDDCDGTTDERGVGTLVAGDLLVTELMKDPAAVEDNFGEWFEIQNATDGLVDLEHLTFANADESLLLKVYGSTLLESGAYFVFAVNENSDENGGVPADYDYSYGGFNVGNAGSIVIDADGTEIGSVDYSELTVTEGVSVGLVDGAWCDQRSTYGDGDLGTPGAANDACADTVDDDADGYTLDVDCDDADESVNPGAEEVWYDGVDQDCDENDSDQDEDGYDGLEAGGEDCDDTDATANPGGTEVWYDGVDQDCDGNDTDFDGDSFEATEAGGDDCDDTDASVNPDATEVHYNGIDENCASDEYDADGDGFDHDSYGGTDCDDADASISPAATEVWYDGVDGDCDGASDYDADADTFDSDAYGGDDCDDGDSAVNPDAADLDTDGTDQDCDGVDGVEVTDDDGDGFDSSEDCDDGDAAVNPGATEVWYDGTDSDCDGLSDFDADGDGYDSDGYLGDDCDDTDAAVNPGATDDSVDGTDQDCDGEDGPQPGEWDASYEGQIEVTVDAGFVGTDTCTGELLVEVDETGTPHLYGVGDCVFPPTGIINTYTGTDTYDVELDGTVTDASGAGTLTMTTIGDTSWSGTFSGTDPWVLDGSFSGSGSFSGVGFTYDGSFSVATASGGGDTGDTGGADTGGADTGGPSYTYVYSDIEAIWAADCTYCHTSGGSSGNLDLDAGYASVVDTPSDDLPSMDLIEPGDTSNSYLWLKIQGTHSAAGGAGSTMPLGGSMSAANQAILQTWIEEGAPETASGGDTGSAYTYSFADDVLPVIAANCTDYGCHSIVGGTNGGYGEKVAYSELVDVPSSDVPSMDRVEPGDSANSYFFHKIAGTHGSVGGAGVQMPLGYPAVSAADQLLIQTWIDEGAPEN